MLGWIAERHPELVRRIVREGHELASHGYDHTRVHSSTRRSSARTWSARARLLEDIGGVAVRGYRAPSYSINGRNLWALDVLQETGHAYSSSIYPIRHDLYGMPEAPRFPFRVRPDAILEIPVTTVRVGGSETTPAVAAAISGCCRTAPSAGCCAGERARPAVRACSISIPGRSIPRSHGSRARRSSRGSGTT